LIEQLDDIILKIDHERGRIERFEEACLDMVKDMHQSNRSKGTNIPERFITKLEQMDRDSNSIDTSISARLSMIQDIRFVFVPEPEYKESPPIPVVQKIPNKRKINNE
jgi:hypothetical protein